MKENLTYLQIISRANESKPMEGRLHIYHTKHFFRKREGVLEYKHKKVMFTKSELHHHSFHQFLWLRNTEYFVET